MSLLFAALISCQSHAVSIKQFFRSFCEKHLISDDPYPYAEEETETLIQFFERTHSAEAKKELLFRLESKMAIGDEAFRISQALRGSE